jgi:DNA-binding response OmpR family regulator
MPKIRILVVDDAVVFRRMVAEELSNDPALEVVGTASNGRIALARMAQVSPDLVILDVEMPEMNGFDFLRAVRAQREYDAVRILMVTSESQSEQVIRALNAGANEYLMKPFNKDVLVAKLNLLDVYQE